MKHVKLVGLALLATFALGAFAASIAQAEEGFLPTQTTANLLGGVSTLEVEGGGKIVCNKLDESEIKLTNDKHGKVLIHWLECKAEGLFAMNSLGDASGTVLLPLLLLVCLDPKGSAGTLLAEFGVSAEVEGTAHLEIPAVAELLEVNGAVLGTIIAKAEENKTLFGLNIEGKGGKQTVTDCLEGANVKLHTWLMSVNHGTLKPASINATGGLIQFKEQVRLMDS